MRHTDPSRLRELESRLAALPGEALVSLPAAFVDGVLRDLRDAQAACEALEDYRARIACLEEWTGGAP